MTFVMTGEVGVGYRMLNQIYTAKKFGQNIIIGDYYCLTNKTSEFLYAVLTEVTGFAINKKKLEEVYEKYSEYGKIVKARTVEQYKQFIRNPLHDHRQETMEKFLERSDYHDVRKTV
jgi:hypothetical protein